ncbi:CU044_5270 family protein [Streptomyces sp. NBC_00647]|uniref:CU044_5270 family protein n=1 Tax=Streptomyces sp. NBC_00647 TaxID=2975796 RepID=UPI003244E2E2
MHDTPELDQLRDWDAGASPLDEITRHRMRARLVSALHGSAPAVRRRRPSVRIALTGAVATAVVATTLVVLRDDTGAGAPAPGSSSSSPALRNVSAQTVLRGAAAFSRERETTIAPRDDQFIYTRTITKDIERKTGTTRTFVDEDWRSVDGSKPSWVMEVGKGWWAKPRKTQPGDQARITMWPPQDWASLKSLSTDPRKLVLQLSAGDPTHPGRALDSRQVRDLEADEWPFIERRLVSLLMLVSVTPKGLRAAAFEALALVPGVKVLPNQKDAAGRPGIAIQYLNPTSLKAQRSMVLGGSSFVLIFAPKTYEFLGYRAPYPKGDKFYDRFTYLDTWAVTDRAKQRP